MTLDEILELEGFYLMEPSAHWDAWENVHDGQCAKLELISNLLERYISTSDVIVVVLTDPLLGTMLPIAEAASYIASHVLEGEIQISDPHFKSFVNVSRNGVAMGWQPEATVS